MLAYAGVCWCMLAYAGACWSMLANADCAHAVCVCVCVCKMNTPGVPGLMYAHVCSRMLTYAHVCWAGVLGMLRLVCLSDSSSDTCVYMLCLPLSHTHSITLCMNVYRQLWCQAWHRTGSGSHTYIHRGVELAQVLILTYAAVCSHMLTYSIVWLIRGVATHSRTHALTHWRRYGEVQAEVGNDQEAELAFKRALQVLT